MLSKTRSELLAEGLGARSLDGVVVWRPEEVVMLSGVQPHLGATCCVWLLGEPPVAFLPASEPEECRPKGWRVREISFDGKWDPWLEMQRLIRELAGDRRLGWKGEAARSSPAGNAAESPPFPPGWASGLPGERAADLVDFLLARKTQQDVERLCVANRVAERGLRRFRECLEPGITEAGLAAQVEASVHEASGCDGVGLARAWASVQAGPNASRAGYYSRSRGRRLVDGDWVVLELAVCADGYWSDLTRTLSVGTRASGEWEAVGACLSEAQERAFASLRPGALACDVDAAARDCLRGAPFGASFPHATGHPTGFRYHDPGPVLGPGCRDVIEEGMVLTLEPGLYGGPLCPGYRIEGNVLVEAEGARWLSPREELP